MCQFLCIFGHRWGFKCCSNSRNRICVCHVVFDWKMVLVSMGGVPMSSDVSKCVNFCVFLDIAGVSKDALSQKTIFVFIMLENGIGVNGWSPNVQRCVKMCQFLCIFGHRWCFKRCTKSKNHICVYHVVFD